MSIKHILLALFVALAWGLNFVAVKTAFVEIPPFLFLTLRFLACSLPLLAFVPRPKIAWKYLLGISVFQWIAHFSLIFIALYLGMPGGLASVVLQSQILFTIVFSCLWLKSRLNLMQFLGVLVALIGMGLIGLQTGISGNLIAFVLLVAAAATISVANVMYKKIGDVNMLSLVVWSSLIPPLPMFALSLYFEGWTQIVHCCQCMSWISAAAIGYTSLVSTLLGLSVWAYLMNRNDPSHVVPFSLMIPVFGLSSTALFLGESLDFITVSACTVVMLGLGINQWPVLKPLLLRSAVKRSSTPIALARLLLYKS
ncbi:MAG: EamA family transporter [Pseudomonadota bacterium]